MKKEPYIGRTMTRHRPMSKRDKVDPVPVREHVEFLQSIGMTGSMIARAAGVTERVVYDLTFGKTTFMLRPSADALLSVSPRPHSQQAVVLAYGVRRRIEGLFAMGWSGPEIASELGTNATYPNYLRRQIRAQWRTHCALAEVYERCALTDRGSTKSKLLARREGFVHPMLWDDIDDWFEVPDLSMLRTPKAARGNEAMEERRTEVARLTRSGMSAADIAARLRVDPRTVTRDRAIAC